jgi:DNA repair protein RadC
MIVSEKHTKVYSPDTVAEIVRSLIADENPESRDQEHFYVLGLNHKNVIQYIDLVSLGTVNEALIHPREVFRLAIMRGCSSIIIAHNHPSNDLTLSEEDKDCTDRLHGSAKILGIPLLDHVIVSDDSFYSFQEEGYFEDKQVDQPAN